MSFRTKIQIENSSFSLSYDDRILMLGSCFSDNLGYRLKRSKFQILSNPLGIVFNPASICRQMDYCLDKRELNMDHLENNDSLWHHFDFHGRYSQSQQKDCLESIRKDLEKTKLFIAKCKVVYITLGTAHVYERISSGDIVANNHKFPIDGFRKKRLEIDEVSSSLSKMIEDIQKVNPKVKVVFTISPVRYLRDGFVENQRSKAILILAVDRLVNGKNTFYFPSYEIFMDALREYRFYAKDLCHPSEIAVDYVWKIFKEYYFDEASLEMEKEFEAFIRSVEHRPIHPESQNHKNFRKKLKQKAEQLREKYPNLSFQKEIDLLSVD